MKVLIIKDIKNKFTKTFMISPPLKYRLVIDIIQQKNQFVYTFFKKYVKISYIVGIFFAKAMKSSILDKYANVTVS